MTMTLAEAIAELRRADAETIYTEATSVAWNVIEAATISGELIPATDARLAVALVVEKAADLLHQVGVAGDADNDPLRSLILALADTDAMVALQALRDELRLMKTAGIIEVMIRNPGVADYVTRLEARADAEHARGDRLADKLVAAEARADAAVTVKPLAWEDMGENFARAPAPLFGNIRVEKYGDFYTVAWSAPGYSNTFTDGDFPTREAAKAAAQADYDARVIAALQVRT